MILVLLLFFASLLLGQLGAISLQPGITFYTHDVVLGIVYVVFFFRLRKQLPWLNGQLLRPLFAFVFIALVSLFVNVDRFSLGELFKGSLYLWRFVYYALLYIVVRNDPALQKYWVFGLYLFGVFLAGLGIIQYVYYPSLRNLLYLGWDEHLYRLFSTLLDPNFVGIILALTFLLGIQLLQRKREIILITQAIVGVSFLLTYSRSSFLALGVSLLLLAVQTRQKIILALIAVAVVIYTVLPGHGIDVNRITRVDSALARISNWQQSIPLFLKSPFIGIGFNMLRAQAKIDRPEVDEVYQSRDAGGLNSSIFVVLVTTGVIGFTSFLYLMKGMYDIVSPRKDMIGMIGGSSLIAIFIHSFFNNTIFYPWVMIWIWILIGTIEVAKKHTKEVKKANKK